VLAEAVFLNLLKPLRGTRTAFSLLVTDLNACGVECAVVLCQAVEALGGTTVFLLRESHFEDDSHKEQQRTMVLERLMAAFPDVTPRTVQHVGLRKKTPWFMNKKKVAHLSALVTTTTFHSMACSQTAASQKKKKSIKPPVVVYEGNISPDTGLEEHRGPSKGNKLLQSHHIGQFDLIWDAEGYSSMGSAKSDRADSNGQGRPAHSMNYLARKEAYAQTLYDFLKPRGTVLLTSAADPSYDERISLHEVDVVFRGEERFKCNSAALPVNTALPLSSSKTEEAARSLIVLTRFGHRHKPMLRFPSCPCCQ
jgi:hypothetical protein